MTEVRTQVEHRAPPEEPLTYEQFLDWLDEDTRGEWIDGAIELMRPASRPHQRIVSFFATLLQLLSEEGVGGEVIAAPFQMRLSERPSGREPDVIYVKEERRGIVGDTYVDGPADLVVEVVSPDSVSRDRGEKFVEYEAAGVREYWLVDPLREELVVYRLADDGKYRTAFEGHTGRAVSEVVDGFDVEASWLWDESMPPILEVLREWGIV